MTKTLNPDLSRYRYRLIALSIGASLALFAAFGLTGGRALAATMSPCSSGLTTQCLLGPAGDGGFEIDGNRTVDSTNGIDWNTHPFPMALTHFSDLFKTGHDDGFVQGSFRNDQTSWTCTTHKSDGKDDIKTGDIAIRTVNGQQYLYLDFSRVAGPGTTFIEFNFSQAAQNLATNQGCNAIPRRQTGDLSIEFGFTDGGFAKSFAVEKWTCDYTQAAPNQCTFADVNLGTEGVAWATGFNDPEDNKATYGEAALNMSAIEGLGAVSCDHFGKVSMDSHSSEKEKNEMKDLVAAIPFNGGCPEVLVNPTIATQASAPVTVGGNISDTATLSGGNNPTGTITFQVFGPDDATCTGDPAFTSNATAPVTGNGIYTSASFPTTAPGTYRFVATYSGDANNNPALGHCNDRGESVVVNPAAPVVVPTPPVVPSPPAGGTQGNGTTVTPPAGGVAPATIALPSAGAGPQGSSPLSGAAFGMLLVLALIGLLAVSGCVLDARRNSASAEA